MKTIRKIILLLILILSLYILNSCAALDVSAGVNVYAPGAWGHYDGAYYPPVSLGYPIY